jgi:hypothetical protein
LTWLHMCQLQTKFKLETIFEKGWFLAQENYNLIEEHNLFEELKVEDN